MNYEINLQDDYVVPEGILTKEQYIEFVMNMAAKNYMRQYNATNVADGLDIAVSVYNSTVPEPTQGV